MIWEHNLLGFVTNLCQNRFVNSKPKPPEATAEANVSDLVKAIDRLSGHVEVLGNVISEIRDEFNWITRNGVPHQPITHVIVKRMAKDPFDPQWNERLQVEYHSAKRTDSKNDELTLDNIVAKVETLSTLADEDQRDQLLIELDLLCDRIAKTLPKPEPVQTQNTKQKLKQIADEIIHALHSANGVEPTIEEIAALIDKAKVRLMAKLKHSEDSSTEAKHPETKKPNTNSKLGKRNQSTLF